MPLRLDQNPLPTLIVPCSLYLAHEQWPLEPGGGAAWCSWRVAQFPHQDTRARQPW